MHVEFTSDGTLAGSRATMNGRPIRVISVGVTGNVPHVSFTAEVPDAQPSIHRAIDILVPIVAVLAIGVVVAILLAIAS